MNEISCQASCLYFVSNFILFSEKIKRMCHLLSSLLIYQRRLITEILFKNNVALYRNIISMSNRLKNTGIGEKILRPMWFLGSLACGFCGAQRSRLQLSFNH